MTFLTSCKKTLTQEELKKDFSDQKIEQLVVQEEKPIFIYNPISSELNVLRRSIFSNLLYYLKKNQDRGYEDVSLFEIGPTFHGKNPGDQQVVIGGLRSGQFFKKSWSEKTRSIDIFDVKVVKHAVKNAVI